VSGFVQFQECTAPVTKTRLTTAARIEAQKNAGKQEERIFQQSNQ